MKTEKKRVIEQYTGYQMGVCDGITYVYRGPEAIPGGESIMMDESPGWHPVANFTMEPLAMTTSGEDMEYHVRIRSRARPDAPSTERTIGFTSGNLLNRAQFRKHCIAHGNYLFTGTDRDYDKILMWIMDTCAYAIRLDRLGLSDDGRSYFFCNAAVDQRGRVHHYSKTGYLLMNGQSHAVYFKQVSDDTNDHRPTLRYEEATQPLPTWIKLMYEVHGNAGLIAATWYMASMLSTIIFKEVESFPLLALYGGPATGKSSLLASLRAASGHTGGYRRMTGEADLPYSDIVPLANGMNTLLTTEEYPQGESAEAVDLCKSFWSRMGLRLEGNGRSSDSISVASTLAFTTNDMIKDDALMTRTIFLELGSLPISDERRAAYDSLQRMNEDGISSYVAEVLRHQDLFSQEFASKMEEAELELRMLVGDHADNRMVRGYAVLLAVYGTYAKLMDMPASVSDFLKALHEAYNNQHHRRDLLGDEGRWWTIVRAAMKDRRITDGNEVFISSNTIAVRLATCVRIYHEDHRVIYGTVGLTASSLKAMLERSSAYIGQSNERTAHAMRFDLDKIPVAL
jgi:uncharacterized protein YktA (UPF0223 family)